MVESFFGRVDSVIDALLIIEACRLGKLKFVERRLTDFERRNVIRAGAVFCWEEQKSGIKR